MFIKIGDLKGESSDDTHKDDIDVLAWSWGLSNSGNAHMAGGAGAGKVNCQDLSLTKYIDLSSAKLIEAVCTGDHFEEAKLVVRKASGGDSPLEYIKITMKTVYVTNVSTGGSGGEDRLTENITLNFAEAKFEYFAQDNSGESAGDDNIAYNFQNNKKVA